MNFPSIQNAESIQFNRLTQVFCPIYEKIWNRKNDSKRWKVWENFNRWYESHCDTNWSVLQLINELMDSEKVMQDTRSKQDLTDSIDCLKSKQREYKWYENLRIDTLSQCTYLFYMIQQGNKKYKDWPWHNETIMPCT